MGYRARLAVLSTAANCWRFRPGECGRSSATRAVAFYRSARSVQEGRDPVDNHPRLEVWLFQIDDHGKWWTRRESTPCHGLVGSRKILKASKSHRSEEH